MAEIDDTGAGGEAPPAGKPARWEQFRLPVEMSGRSFLDVGCWEGAHCAEAVRRAAETVVGVDICTGEDLRANVDRFGFEFLQMDVFGELWQGLGSFDVVLCSGLLYSVPSPMSLLLRLAKVTGELLVVESASTTMGGEDPVMLFRGTDDGNRSNWWIPNRPCLEQMLAAAGFAGVATVWEEPREEHWTRVCMHAVPRGIDRERLLPRKPKLMSVRGGDRRRGRGDSG